MRNTDERATMRYYVELARESVQDAFEEIRASQYPDDYLTELADGCVPVYNAMQYVQPSKKAKPRGYADRMEAWRNAVEALAGSLPRTNPRFDRERFVAACYREES